MLKSNASDQSKLFFEFLEFYRKESAKVMYDLPEGEIFSRFKDFDQLAEDLIHDVHRSLRNMFMEFQELIQLAR